MKTITVNPTISAVAAILGRLGRGKSKRRGDSAYYRNLAAKRKHPGRKPRNP